MRIAGNMIIVIVLVEEYQMTINNPYEERRTQSAGRFGIDDDIIFLRDEHPEIYSLLDPKKITDRLRRNDTEDLDTLSWEFESGEAGGRGEAYNVAQRSFDNRRVGMNGLLSFFSPSFSDLPPSDYNILDVLAGDGTVANFASFGDRPHASIISSDISRFMVEACRRKGFACLRQSATDLLFAENSLDGVLIAYGSHHLGARARYDATREAHRTLSPDRRLVLHDFEVGSGTARWFEEVVHPFSRTGHPHPHFTRSEMFDLMNSAGFRDVRVLDLPDPFTLHGHTREEAHANALMHVYRMYDLVKISNDQQSLLSSLEHHVSNTFGEIAIHAEGEGYVATIARRALVAVGTKTD